MKLKSTYGPRDYRNNDIHHHAYGGGTQHCERLGSERGLIRKTDRKSFDDKKCLNKICIKRGGTPRYPHCADSDDKYLFQN